jgi:hypothetical protein
MRASFKIVQGYFCGGEIEPGTFHVKEFDATFAPGDQADSNDADTSGHRTSADTAPVKDAATAPAPNRDQEVPTTRR